MISIQPVQPEQADQLTQIALAAKTYWGYPRRWLEIWRPQLTFGPEYFIVHGGWAALVNDTPIGFYTLEEKNRNAWLENLWVLPDYIGKGVGKILFLHAVELSHQRGHKVLQLEADPNAVGFYERMGMHKIGERHSEVDGQARVLPIMEIWLAKHDQKPGVE